MADNEADLASSKEMFPEPKDKLWKEDIKAALPDIKGLRLLRTMWLT